MGVCAVLSLSALAASLESPLVMLGMKRSDRHLRDGWGSAEGNPGFPAELPKRVIVVFFVSALGWGEPTGSTSCISKRRVLEIQD